MWCRFPALFFLCGRPLPTDFLFVPTPGTAGSIPVPTACSAAYCGFLFNRAPALFPLPSGFPAVPHAEGPRPCRTYSAAYFLFWDILGQTGAWAPELWGPGLNGLRDCWMAGWPGCLGCLNAGCLGWWDCEMVRCWGVGIARLRISRTAISTFCPPQ